MKLCPCIDMLYKGYDLKEALLCIKEAGFQGFECWDYNDWGLSRLAEAAEELKLQITNIGPDFASLADAKQRKQFVKEIEKALEAGKRLSAGCLTVLSGDDTGENRTCQHASIVAGLREAAPIAESAGITIVLEASNRRVNRPDNYLTSSDETFEIIDEVGSPFVKMLYDIYHQQISEGDLLSRIIPNIDKIGHFHAAGVPYRHELHLSEINYDFLFQEIQKADYQNWIGLEYQPALPVEDGIERLKKYL